MEASQLVYLVDDNPTWLRALARMLRLDGAEVVTFETAAAVMASLDEALPDLIVLDFDLGPSGTGEGLARRLRRELAGSCPPLVLLTGQLMAVTDEELAVFDAALSKSTPPTELSDELLERARASTATRSAPRLRSATPDDLEEREDPRNGRASG